MWVTKAAEFAPMLGDYADSLGSSPTAGNDARILRIRTRVLRTTLRDLNANKTGARKTAPEKPLAEFCRRHAWSPEIHLLKHARRTNNRAELLTVERRVPSEG